MKNQKNEKIKKIGLDLLADVISGILLAVAIYCFAVPANFPMTGVSGVAMILYHLFGLPVGVMTILFNIPIILCCYRTLGRKFFIRSVRTTFITSVIMDLVGPAIPVYQGETILAAICAGVLCGIGYGLVFLRDSSTGGFDFIIMTIRAYHPHITIGKIAFVMDCMVILAGAYFYNSVDAVIYGLLLNYLYSVVLDRVVYGMDAGKLTMIITDMPKEVASAIDTVSGRGCTLLRGEGAYSGTEKQVVMCASSNKEMVSIRKRTHEVDPNAFVIVLDSNEVIGEGFHVPEALKSDVSR